MSWRCQPGSVDLFHSCDELHVAVSVLVDKAALCLLLRVHFVAHISIAVAILHCEGGQLHPAFLRGNYAVPVCSHTSHHCCRRGLRLVCFGKQSEFLEDALVKHFRPLTCTTTQTKIGIYLESSKRWDGRSKETMFSLGLRRSLLFHGMIGPHWQSWAVEITHRQSKRSEEMWSQTIQFAQRKWLFMNCDITGF